MHAERRVRALSVLPSAGVEPNAAAQIVIHPAIPDAAPGTIPGALGHPPTNR
jgi:hypothetical protein